ncbi:MAG: T9SS type A sorting domain-containing protein [Bacteroidota bacterium]
MQTLLLTCILVVINYTSFAQAMQFPQERVNAELQSGFLKQSVRTSKLKPDIEDPTNTKSLLPVLNMITQIKESFSKNKFSFSSAGISDTVFVGDVPNDTLIITGNYTHTGPIFVFNDGVLIFQNATVIDSGDIYVFQNGRLLADSSSFTFPQEYFYQRGLIAVQNASVLIKNSSFNYSGMSHNLVIGDSAIVLMANIHQNDWTTCGLFGYGTLKMDGCNLGGEYILSDFSSASFAHVDTLLLWHQLPESSLIDFAFPAGDSVYNYHFNNTISGVDRLDYDVSADSCHNVMWALMPVNGSDVKISSSVIRAIGAWFRGTDTVSVHGIFDNSSYINYVAPLSDRNLHLVNCDVQTWSMYVFDSSHVIIDSCQLGEVGCQQRSSVLGAAFILDGSGGYYWCTDTSAVFATGVSIYTTARSERNGIFFLAYSWLPFLPPSAIANSLLVSVQNNLISDPVPYDNAVVWMGNIMMSDSANLNSLSVPVTGSAWIDQGPLGGWMFFGSYSLYYQEEGELIWHSITTNQVNEVHTGNLGNWSMNGMTPGTYILKLVIKNSFADSVEAIKRIQLVNISAVQENKFINSGVIIYPNPSDGNFTMQLTSEIKSDIKIEIENAIGQKVYSEVKEVNSAKTVSFDNLHLKPGVYLCNIISSEEVFTGKIVIR